MKYTREAFGISEAVCAFGGHVYMEHFHDWCI